MLYNKNMVNKLNDEIIFQQMCNEARELLEKRFPNGEGGVGVVRIEDGRYLTSVWNETNNSCVDLCAETGAILEAHKLNKKITHSLCLVREESGERKILTPCGVCQERLYFFGGDVKCAINSSESDIKFLTLAKLQPYYWKK